MFKLVITFVYTERFLIFSYAVSASVKCFAEQTNGKTCRISYTLFNGISDKMLWFLIYYFRLFLKNILSAIYVDWVASPVVCYILHLLITLSCRYWWYATNSAKKFKKSCFRRKKDTWHIESNHILQPPEYLIIFVNWLSYNNYVTKISAPCLWTGTWCLVPINAACRMHATVIHSVRSMYSAHYTTSGKCFKNTPFWFLANCTQVVVVEGESRRPELVTSGVPQG